MRIKKVAQITANIISWIAGGILLLILLLSLLVQLNPVQQILVQKAVDYVEPIIGTPVSVKAIKLKFPKSLAVEGIYIEDQQGDTLFSSELISVDIALFRLFRNELKINNIQIKGVTGNIHRKLPDGQFNFDYIVDAFTSNRPTPPDTDTSEPMIVSIWKIQLQDIKLKYTDEVEGLNAQLQLGKLNLNFNKTDLQKQFIDVNNIELEHTWAKVELLQQTENQPTNNFSHLELSKLNLSARDLSYSSELISGQVNMLSFNSADGFVLNKLQTRFEYSATHVKLEDLYLETPHSQLHNQIEARFPSIDSIMSNPEQLVVAVDFNKNLVGFADLLAFVPALSTTDPFRHNPEASIRFSGSISGALSDLNLQDISISTLDDTHLQFSGSISGLPDIKKSKAHVALQNLATTKTDLSRLLPKDMLPDMVQLPKHISLSGTIIGSMRQVSTTLHMQSTSGNAVLQADVVHYDKTDKVTYALSIDLDQLNEEPIVSIEMEGCADLSTTFPAADFKLRIGTLNLQALNLSDADMVFSGSLSGSFPSTNPDSLVGTIETNDFLLLANGVNLPIGMLTLTAHASPNEQQISLNSAIVQASLKGNYQLTKVSGELLSVINQHLSTPEIRDSIASTPQQFDFRAQINNHPVISEFLPQLSHFDTIYLRGNFNSQQRIAHLHAEVKNLIFSDVELNEMQFSLTSNSDSLAYQLTLEQVNFEAYQINHISAHGGAKNKQASLWFNIKDLEQVDKYHVGLTATFSDSLTLLRLMPDRFMMNYQSWNVQAGNTIEIDSAGFNIRNLRLWSQNQELRIEGSGTSPGVPLQIDLTNFNIASLSALAETDTLLAKGIITGQVQVQQLNTSPIFEGDLYIADFSIYNDTVGNIQLNANNIEPHRYTVRALISGKGNELLLDGYYHIPPEGDQQFSFDADVHHFSLASAEPFTMAYVRDLSGSMNGKMKINGTLEQPKVRGMLNFDQASFNVDMLNATFSLDKESIEFVSDGIRFDNFALRDENDNQLSVNGNLLTTNYRDYVFEVDIHSQNIRVLNSTRADNDLFHGQVYLNTTLRIRGDLDNPQVNGLIRINPLSDFTFIVPQTSPELIKQDGVVAFVDMSNPDTTDKDAAYDSLNMSRIKGLDVTLRIEIDTTAQFTVIVDEGSGDKLEIQGEARLSAGIDPGGQLSLTGTYEVTRGAYELSFNMIRRRFIIQRGSLITWQGKPMDAITNITAKYKTNASAYNLVENKLNEPIASLNRYKQALPFEVLLHMQGELLKPQLSFDIKLPDGNYRADSEVISTIQNQLVQLRNNESELNKQVFSLLLLNSFVPENPFTANNVESTARSSASRLLSDQMNQLTGNLIHGVDFNFDLVSEEDYTTGAQQYRTDLNVDISKTLLNDRLKVSVGSNFELEGPQNSNREATNLAGNVALDYRLSRDGRYLLRTYRKNEYQGVAEGYIIETGVSFIFTFDYSEIREILKRKEEETP